MHLIAVFVENKPGQTARITKILAGAGINIHWATIANSGAFGVMKFLVDKLDAAVSALKQNGLMVSLVEVLAVETPNEPGALQRIADTLASRKLNLANCSGFVVNHRAVLIVELPELQGAREVLLAEGFRLLTQDEVMSL
jgi:hypothetical protein